MNRLFGFALFAGVVWSADLSEARTWKTYNGTVIEGEVARYDASEITVGRYQGVVCVGTIEYQTLHPDHKHVVDEVAYNSGYRDAKHAAISGKGRPVSMVNPMVTLRNQEGKETTISIYLLDDDGLTALAPGFHAWYAKVIAERQRLAAAERERKAARRAAAEAGVDSAQPAAAWKKCSICGSVCIPTGTRIVDGIPVKVERCNLGHETLTKIGAM
jgi:hypothetical protein